MNLRRILCYSKRKSSSDLPPDVLQMQMQMPLNVQYAMPLLIKRYPLIWFPYELTENPVLLEAQELFRSAAGCAADANADAAQCAIRNAAFNQALSAHLVSV